jgi:hypothetical protein
MTGTLPEHRIAQLENEIVRLRSENDTLMAKVAFFENHPTLSSGIRGETIVASLLDGVLADTNADYDVSIERKGLRLEVKFSRLNSAVRNRKNPTRRWAWAKPLGESGNKRFDRLILIGVKDQRFLHLYLGQSCSSYIFFDVPYHEIGPLTIQTNAGKYRSIQLTTNPSTSRASAGMPLFNHYQVTLADLENRYGI